MEKSLAQQADDVLITALSPDLKHAIDHALAAGQKKRDILRAVRQTQGHRGLVTLAVEAYLETRKPS